MKKPIFIICVLAITSCATRTTCFPYDNDMLIPSSSIDHSKKGDRLNCYEFVGKTIEKSLVREKNKTVHYAEAKSLFSQRITYPENIPSKRKLEVQEDNKELDNLILWSAAVVYMTTKERPDFIIQPPQLSKRSYFEKYQRFPHELKKEPQVKFSIPLS